VTDIESLPQIGADVLRRDWDRIVVGSAGLLPCVVTTGAIPSPAALLLPFPLAAQVSAAHGTADIVSHDTAIARDVLPDLLYRAARLQQATGIMVRFRKVAAFLPLSWADSIPTPQTPNTTPEGESDVI
jgi:hypothetical protein